MTLFTACEPDNFSDPTLNGEGNFVDKNRQWLIDNSPFYLTESNNSYSHRNYFVVYNIEDYGVELPAFQLIYGASDNLSRIENYSFSISFLENDVLVVNECVNGSSSTEISTWEMRFSDRINAGTYGGEDIYYPYTGFFSPILHFKENSSILFVEKTLSYKIYLEQNRSVSHKDDGYGSFPEIKFGGADNTIELKINIGYTERNSSTGELKLLQQNPYGPLSNYFTNENPELSYSFSNESDIYLGSRGNHLINVSYVNEWGYYDFLYDNIRNNNFDYHPTPWADVQFLSINNPKFSELPESTQQRFLNCGSTTDPCVDLACVNGTATTGIEGNCFCDCEPGWTGPNCDQPITALPVNMQLLAGDGTQGNADGTFGRLNYPQSMVTSADGTVVYIADSGSKSIRTVNPINNEVTTLLGGNAEGYQDGDYASARFSSFGDIALDDAGNIYVSDSGNHVIRKISGGQVTTYAGTGIGGLTNGLASAAQFKYPIGLLIRNNTMYVADNENGCIRAIAMNDDPNLRTVTTYAGNGMLGHVDGANASASFAGPRDIAYDAFNDRFLVTEYNVFGGASGANLRGVTATQTTTLTLDLPGSQTMINPAGIAADTDGSFYLSDRQTHALYHFTDFGVGFYAASMETAGLYQTPGNLGGVPGDSRLNFPNLLYIGTSLNSSSQLETRLYIANVLGQSVWYIPLRLE